ncbi:uncharacterized protein [Argopecten irradians]|uniref:uncharacterized protein isoform X1 n=1 Tax=Argopecten irradians TaxID=31199 RepID=UPI00371B0A1B
MLRFSVLMSLCVAALAMPADKGAIRNYDQLVSNLQNILHNIGDYFKRPHGLTLRGESDPVPTADASLLHQVGDFFKGRSLNSDNALRSETDPVPTANTNLLHQFGDFFKGKRSMNRGKSLRSETDPVPTSDGTLLHQVGDFFKGKKSLHTVHQQPLSPQLLSDILHELGDYFKGGKRTI